MRIIIPREIEEMLEKQAPYLRYEKGKGQVLSSDAPPEIIRLREKTQKWFDENRAY